MSTEHKNRRQFLRGAGGVTLALPFLPSLLPRSAKAAVPGGMPPRLVLIAQIHGGYFDRFHGKPTLPNKMPLYPGHDMNWGPLSGPSGIATTSDGRTTISPILNAPSNVLRPELIKKMNVLRGLDSPSASGHTWAAFGNLGTEARTNGEGSTCQSGNCFFPPYGIPSVDQLAAWSDSYYPKDHRASTRSIQTGPANNQSWVHNVASTASGYTQAAKSQTDPNKLFTELFMDFTVPTPGVTPPLPVVRPPLRQPLVDYLLDSYKNLRTSGRLSTLDKQRLDGHIDSLAQLQKDVNNIGTPIPTGVGCSKPNVTMAPKDESAAHFAVMNDIISMAFKCGISRIATIQGSQQQTTFFDGGIPVIGGNPWHELCHQSVVRFEGNSVGHAKVYQKFFEKIVLDLANKLDVTEAGDQTYLDNTLIVFNNSEGVYTHTSSDLAIATLGGAGGALKTGNFIDYRNLTKKIGSAFAGLYVNQFWATVIKALGIPRREWDRYGTPGKGYGPLAFSQTSTSETMGKMLTSGLYVDGVSDNSGNSLPILT